MLLHPRLLILFPINLSPLNLTCDLLLDLLSSWYKLYSLYSAVFQLPCQLQLCYLFSFRCHCRDCDFVWFYIITTVAVFNKLLSRFLRNEQGPLVSWQRLAGTLPLFHCSDLRRRCLPVSLRPQCWVSGSRLRKYGVASVSEVSKLGLGASSWDSSLYPVVPGGQWGNSGKKGLQKLGVCPSSERADRVLPSGGMQCGANRKGEDCVPLFEIMETDIFLPHLLGKGRPSCPVEWWLPLVISKPVGMTSSREHRVRSVYVFWNRWCVPISWNQRGVGGGGRSGICLSSRHQQLSF